jgi:hypothetical protein
MILNMSEDTVEMPLPQLLGRRWYRAIDIERASPEDAVEPLPQHQVGTATYKVASRSVVVLESRGDTDSSSCVRVGRPAHVQSLLSCT